MIDRTEIHQGTDDLVDVTSWSPYGEYEVFPRGARSKTLLLSPSDTDQAFLVPNHRYLFKESFRQDDQFWAEIIAFRIGRLMGVSVPPAFVAWHGGHEEPQPGALIEWFVGYNGSAGERIVHAGDIYQRLYEDFDHDKGTQHNLRDAILMCRAYQMTGRLSQNWKEYWALCLAFDAVIGNTDRHQENWAFVWDADQNVRLSPVFDNGTSLGYEFPSFDRFARHPEALDAYIGRGTHHMRPTHESDKISHADMVHHVCNLFPEVIDSVLEALCFNSNELKSILEDLCRIKVPVPLSEERAIFVHQLVTKRQLNLLASFGV